MLRPSKDKERFVQKDNVFIPAKTGYGSPL